MSNKILQVRCDSVNDSVVISDHDNTLCELTWSIKDNELGGFSIRNSMSLVDVYPDNFFILSEIAALQFIMNVVDKIKVDQQIEEVVYMTSDDTVIPLPIFLPCTVPDEFLHMLPQEQLSLCEAWHTFKTKFDGMISIDFLYAISESLQEGFTDLVNVELSLLRKEES
jgi:hypothetical protein